MRQAQAVWVLGLLLTQGCAVASIGASRYLAPGAADLTSYQLARESPLFGVIGYETMAVFRPVQGGSSGWMAGIGADLTLPAGDPDSPYLIGGVQAGIGTRAQPATWSSWSLGAGSQLLQVGPLGVRGEARYRRLSADSRAGLEVGMRLGRGWRRRSNRAERGVMPSVGVSRSLPDPLAPGTPVGGAGDAKRHAVVGIAAEAMGTPYRWGGTSADGFDCSGLIQFSYREVGISLPRRSVEQAAAGLEVGRDTAALLPGDILTFATGAPGEVSHVGLYLGEGRFIHSATGGVQVSILSATDPYGRWWWQRWLGTRRIVP